MELDKQETKLLRIERCMQLFAAAAGVLLSVATFYSKNANAAVIGLELL
jgi:hypothetical protein